MVVANQPGLAGDEQIGQAEPGGLSADDQVAAERDLEAAAQRIAADRGDGRLRQRLELVEDAAALELIGGESLRPVFSCASFTIVLNPA